MSSARTAIYWRRSAAGKRWPGCGGRCLSEQERQVVVLRYGLGGGTPLRQRQVAERLGLSRSYISRIEKRALGKLRAELE